MENCNFCQEKQLVSAFEVQFHACCSCINEALVGKKKNQETLERVIEEKRLSQTKVWNLTKILSRRKELDDAERAGRAASEREIDSSQNPFAEDEEKKNFWLYGWTQVTRDKDIQRIQAFLTWQLSELDIIGQLIRGYNCPEEIDFKLKALIEKILPFLSEYINEENDKEESLGDIQI